MQVELYSRLKDPASEALIEAALNTNEIYYTKGSTYLESKDSYYAFKKQLDLFVNWLRTGVEPVDFADTVEMMKIVIAGIRSREEGGRVVYLDEIN